ncbi:IS3 family transposase [Arthrobacter sp. MA-N2]|uniref:IS3 family transposase n=1 Tax=Arthrobacter sp. MA-N2 TaxID=1101188 RepID=UPI000486DFA3|nr:IS3 family transposase [Arthrobacter sp. MA-N2]
MPAQREVPDRVAWTCGPDGRRGKKGSGDQGGARTPVQVMCDFVDKHRDERGVERICKELRGRNIPAAQFAVERLMRAQGLDAISRAKGPCAAKPAPQTGRPSDLIERRFAAAAPNRLLVAA